MTTREPKADEKFLRHGDLPESGRSFNHRDGHDEAGVSVYRLTRVGRAWKLLDGYGAAIFAEKPTFVVTGKVLVDDAGRDLTGSDGEPLLSNVRVLSRSRREPYSYL
jgi:hypothetical protein